MDNSEKLKLNLLVDTANVLLNPITENYDKTKSSLSKLANYYHVDLIKTKINDKENIEKKLLKNIAEIIINHRGFMELLPETYDYLRIFASQKNI